MLKTARVNATPAMPVNLMFPVSMTVTVQPLTSSLVGHGLQEGSAAASLLLPVPILFRSVPILFCCACPWCSALFPTFAKSRTECRPVT